MSDDNSVQKLTLMMADMGAKLEALLDKHDELAHNISQIKEAVYDPDKGLYARLSRLDARLDALEAWKSNNTRVLWMVGAACIGLILNSAWTSLF
jgi:hypothetical protein